MPIHPTISLMFDGRCAEAFALYAACLGGTVTFQLTWGNSPMADQAPPEWHDKILHMTLAVGGTTVSGGDVLAGVYRRPQGFQLQLDLNDAATAERIFTTLADGGEVTVPLQQTFWAERFAVVVDRFGIPWAINCGEGQD